MHNMNNTIKVCIKMQPCNQAVAAICTKEGCPSVVSTYEVEEKWVGWGGAVHLPNWSLIFMQNIYDHEFAWLVNIHGIQQLKQDC